MKKRFCLGSLAVALLGLGMVHGQSPTYSPPVAGAAGIPGPNAAEQAPDPYAGITGGPPPYNTTKGSRELPAGPGQPPPYPPGLSSWLTYPRSPLCCGPLGSSGPIGMEIYLRNGLALPVGGGIFGDVLHPGWTIQGGARVLFFNPEIDAAWTVDLGINNTNYNATDSRQAILRDFQVRGTDAFGQTTTEVIPEFAVTPTGYNTTVVNVGFGREWYLLGRADGSTDINWRWGLDAGGRYGSAKLDLNEIRHRTDVVGGMYAAIHSDLEYPCGFCILQAGFRCEYEVIWSDILQSHNDTSLQNVNFLFTLGARY